jgi:hypothetical protein
MWSAVEQSDYLLAAQLYLFARHVHTSLMLGDVDGTMGARFPVIDRPWGAVAHFHEAILEGCQRALASTKTDPVKLFLQLNYILAVLFRVEDSFKCYWYFKKGYMYIVEVGKTVIPH